MVWHDDAKIRKAMGDELETLFKSDVTCACGGRFVFIGDALPGSPDFTCNNCGRLVDVKSSPQAEQTGNIAVSAKPWQNYPDDMLLVTRINEAWIGEFKKFIITRNQRPFEPTHNSRGTHLKNTRFYLISWKQFKPICELGLLTSIK